MRIFKLNDGVWYKELWIGHHHESKPLSSKEIELYVDKVDAAQLALDNGCPGFRGYSWKWAIYKCPKHGNTLYLIQDDIDSAYGSFQCMECLSELSKAYTETFRLTGLPEAD